MTPISFITIIKNRTNIQVTHNKQNYTLTLFENNLKSLINLIQPGDMWEYIIVDFASTDVHMQDFITSLPKKDNLKFRIYTLNEPFDKGSGLNYGSTLPTNPVVFFLDADMIIRTRKLFDDIENYVVKQNKVLFPICWSYNDPEHKTGIKRDTGVGNVIQKKETIVPYTRNNKWGEEDSDNFKHYEKHKQAHRTYYDEEFVHQWHPVYIRHIYYNQ
jgi:glycosyltransferase involved in cell wall biosynthesis